MHIRGAVQADTYEKVFFAEKFSPFLGNCKAICLNGILHRDTLLVVLLHGLRKETEEIQPSQGRFPTLKGKRDITALFDFRKTALNQRFRSSERHDAVIRVHAILLLISIKAILAAHVAVARCGLNQELKLLHSTSVCCNTVTGVLPTSRVCPSV